MQVKPRPTDTKHTECSFASSEVFSHQSLLKYKVHRLSIRRFQKIAHQIKLFTVTDLSKSRKCVGITWRHLGNANSLTSKADDVCVPYTQAHCSRSIEFSPAVEAGTNSSTPERFRALTVFIFMEAD